MKQRFYCRISTIFFIAVFIFLIGGVQTKAQQPAPLNTESQTSDKEKEEVSGADVSITANVTAKELKFEIVPNPNVEFSGTHERITIWKSDRSNLPQTVEPGVTYRNIGIQLRIASRFADIDRIVAEALGEVSTADDPKKNQTTKQNLASPPEKVLPNETVIQNNKQTKPRR